MQLLMEHYLSEYSKSIDSPSGIEISTMRNLCHEVFFHPGALFKGMDTYIPPVRVLAAGQKDGRKGPLISNKNHFPTAFINIHRKKLETSRHGFSVVFIIKPLWDWMSSVGIA